MEIKGGIERGDDDYLAGKLEERGYPGLGETRGRHICEWCLNPYNPTMIHDCYEKRNGINLSEKQLADGTTPVAHRGHNCSADPDSKNFAYRYLLDDVESKFNPIYAPHKFQPSQHGLIGAPCMICGGLPTDESHKEEPVTDVDENKLLEQIQKPAVWVERIAPDQARLEIQNIPNDQALRVVLDVLPKALELYLNKSRDYGGNVMSKIDLGPKACIPDMQRKFGKLVDAIWWDKPLQFEQPDEILRDLLGHIFIILDERRDKDMDDLMRVEE